MSQWDDEIRRCLAAANLDPQREIAIAEELAQHLDDRYAELIATGVAPEAARAHTLEELREDTLMRRELSQIERLVCDRIVSGGTRRRLLVADLLQDVRYAARTLRASPGFAAIALLTLALGIGATTAIFSVIDAMLIRPLAYDRRSRLVQVFHADFSRDYFKPEAPQEPARLLPSFSTFQALQARNQVFDRMGWYDSDRLTLLDASPVERVSVAAVSPGFIELFDALPARGRWFVESDVGQPVTIISYGCWQRRFGGDPAIVGSSVRMVEGQRTIVGVLPEDFPYDPSTDFWIPLDASPRGNAGAGGHLMARLKPGVTVEQTRRHMQALTQQLRNAGTLSNRASVEVRSLHEWTMRSTRGMLLLLLAAVGFVLLIACVNVAGLLIARGAGRSHEVAIRASLGAGRSRLLRQLLTESVLLALLGGMAGTLLAWLTLNSLVAVLPVSVPSEVQPTVDIRILGFTLLISGITGLLFGLLPALRISRAGFVTVIKDPGRSARRWRQRTGTALVIVEVALALVLMAGAGLMLRSLHRVLSIDPGFEPERVLVLEAIPVMVGDGQVQRARVFYAELTARVRRLPGVEAVGAIDTLPFWSWAYSSVEVDGPEHKKVDVSPRYVLPGYFQAMGVPLKLGRAFSGADRDGALARSFSTKPRHVGCGTTSARSDGVCV